MERTLLRQQIQQHAPAHQAQGQWIDTCPHCQPRSMAYDQLNSQLAALWDQMAPEERQRLLIPNTQETQV
jgi:hypothetical protein